MLTANRKLNTSYLTLDVHVDKYGRGEQVSRGFEFRWPVRRGPSIRNKRSTLTFWPYTSSFQAALLWDSPVTGTKRCYTYSEVRTSTRVEGCCRTPPLRFTAVIREPSMPVLNDVLDLMM